MHRERHGAPCFLTPLCPGQDIGIGIEIENGDTTARQGDLLGEQHGGGGFSRSALRVCEGDDIHTNYDANVIIKVNVKDNVIYNVIFNFKVIVRVKATLCVPASKGLRA